MDGWCLCTVPALVWYDLLVVCSRQRKFELSIGSDPFCTITLGAVHASDFLLVKTLGAVHACNLLLMP